MRDDLNETIELLENDTKIFEDLEFQYLEEETEWLAYREDLHTEEKTLTRRISEKRKHIESLEAQGIDNQNAACADTKNIERDLRSMLHELDKYREELKTIDVLLYELSGEKHTQSDSDEDLSVAIAKRPSNDIMSQSLFGSQEIFGTKKPHATDLMSKSVNENLFSNKIETLSFSDQPLTRAERDSDSHYENMNDDGMEEEKRSSVSSDKSNKSALDQRNGESAPEIDGESATPGDNSPKPDEELSDPLQKLKYNLSPPFDHKTTKPSLDAVAKQANLNLSIESDDFEVNPLEKRVPSQDDIDRICKVTTNAPISTQGASFKVIESIREIERNRQLLLTQQGMYVSTVIGMQFYALPIGCE